MAIAPNTASTKALPGKCTDPELYSARMASGYLAMDEMLMQRIWEKTRSHDALDAVAFYIGYLLAEPHPAGEADGILKEFYGKMRELSFGYWLSRSIAGRVRDTLNSMKA